MIYKLSHALFYPYFKLYHRLQVIGREHVPPQGVILASNHESYLDPPLVGIAMPRARRVAFIAKMELSESGFLRWYMEQVGTVLIRRGGVNLNLEEQVNARLAAGDCICIFPEGTRSRNGKLGTGKPGVGRFVLRSGAPVVPMFISGTYRSMPPGAALVRPRQVTVRFGTVLTFAQNDRPRKDECRATVEAIMAGIRELAGPAGEHG